MIKIRNPFYRVKKTIIAVQCSRCATSFFVTIENVRTSNYCGSCS